MSEMKEVKRYTDQEIFDCLDIHHMCRGPYVLASAYEALLSEKAALAAERDELLAVINGEFHKRRRIGPDTPDNSMVICPHCTSQFPAISGDDQKRRDALVIERDRLRSAIAWAREVLRDAADTYEIERGKAGSEWHRKLLTKWIDQLRALSSIGDLPAGEEG